MDYQKSIAEAGLKIKAIDINIENPFRWVSGYKMPIYLDNRLFLYYPEYRNLIAEAFQELIEKHKVDCDVIAGVATSGIPFAEILSDLMKKPLIYVRKNKKEHGTGKQIEGTKNNELKGRDVVLIEDLISRGTNSIPAIESLRNAGANCNFCLCIFDYETKQSKANFEKINCNKISILKFDNLLQVIKENSYLDAEQIKLLEEWKQDPFRWGEKHGFPKT